MLEFHVWRLAVYEHDTHDYLAKQNFICQYVAEFVLGITNGSVNGSVDQIHASLQIQDAPLQGYSDALNGTGFFQYSGGVHYPRGITTALWWLNTTNNPVFPVAASAPAAPTVFFAFATNEQVTLSWQGVPLAAAYNLKRGTVSGGPYSRLADGIIGATFTDSGLADGVTYFYVLTATNAIGESPPSQEVSATPVPSASTNLNVLVTGPEVTIAWPATYVGWILQTNAVNLAIPNAWGDVPASLTNRQMVFPINNPAIPAQFFRLRHP